MEMEIWNIFAINRIPGAIGGLSIIIAVWVAARFANVASEASEENKSLFGKLLITAFGGSIIFWGIGINLISQRNWTNTAEAFAGIKAAGESISPIAEKFIETYSGEPSLLNAPGAIVFFAAASLIILFPILFKK